MSVKFESNETLFGALRQDILLNVKDMARRCVGTRPPSMRPVVLEKDVFTTRAIALIASLPSSPYLVPVLCGGTSLSKAYGLLQRMSEDVDFKLVPTEDFLWERRVVFPAELPRGWETVGPAASIESDSLIDARKLLIRRPRSNQQCRDILSKYVNGVEDAFMAAGVSSESLTRKSRDNNTYTSLEVVLPLVNDSSTSPLRDHLKVELNCTPVRNGWVSRPVRLLVDEMAQSVVGVPAPIVAEVATISLEETQVEKLISFSRRLALATRDAYVRGFEPLSAESNVKWDPALVRHVHDTARIAAAYPDLPNNPTVRQMFTEVVLKDRDEWRRQIEFVEDPVAEMRWVLGVASKLPVLKDQYERFVTGMVLDEAPEWPEAWSAFSRVLTTVLDITEADIHAAVAAAPIDLTPFRERRVNEVAAAQAAREQAQHGAGANVSEASTGPDHTPSKGSRPGRP